MDVDTAIGTPSPSGDPNAPDFIMAPCMLPMVVKGWHDGKFPDVPYQEKQIEPLGLSSEQEVRGEPSNDLIEEALEAISELVDVGSSYDPELYVLIPRGGILMTLALAGTLGKVGGVLGASFSTTSFDEKDSCDTFLQRLRAIVFGIGAGKRIAVCEFSKSGETITQIKEISSNALIDSAAGTNLRIFAIRATNNPGDKNPLRNQEEGRVTVLPLYHHVSKHFDDNDSFFGEKGNKAKSYRVKFRCGYDEGEEVMTGYEYILWKIAWRQLMRGVFQK